MDKDPIDEVQQRAKKNDLSKELGIRPAGEVQAKLAEILALEQQLNGVPPDEVADLRDEANRQRKLDADAERFSKSRNTSTRDN